MSQGGLAKIPTAAVLRNRGVPVNLHPVQFVEQDGEGRWVRARQGDDDESMLVPVEQRWLQFTAAVMGDIEDTYGSLDGWEQALRKSPFRALATTLACAFEWFHPDPMTGMPVPDSRRAGVAMMDGQGAAYSTAVGGAFAMANGVSPEKAGEVLRAGLTEVSKATKAMAETNVTELLAAAADDESATPTPPPASPTSRRSTPRGRSAVSTLSSSGG